MKKIPTLEDFDFAVILNEMVKLSTVDKLLDNSSDVWNPCIIFRAVEGSKAEDSLFVYNPSTTGDEVDTFTIDRSSDVPFPSRTGGEVK